MDKEEILYNEIYERTKDFGRTHFIKEIMSLQREYQQLKEINEEHKKLNGELREENKKYKEVIDRIEKYIEKETRIYGLSMSIELGTHFDNILGILKEVE